MNFGDEGGTVILTLSPAHNKLLKGKSEINILFSEVVGGIVTVSGRTFVL